MIFVFIRVLCGKRRLNDALQEQKGVCMVKQRSSGRYGRPFAIVLLLVFVLAACGQPDNPTSAPTQPAREPASSPIPTAAIAPAAIPPATALPTREPEVAQAATAVTNLPIIVSPAHSPNPSTGWNQLAFDPQRTNYIPATLPDTWRFKWIWNGPAAGSDGGPTADHLALPKAVQPVLGDGKLYAGHSDGFVRAISEADGTQVWATQVGGEVLDAAAYDPIHNAVFVGTSAGKVVRLNAADGAITGEFSADGGIITAPLLVNTVLVVGTLGGTLYAIDTGSMAQHWAYSAGAELRSSPAYSAKYGGLVIITSEDKFVHAVQFEQGTRRWRTEVKADQDPQRDNRRFPDTYPVVSDANEVVIIRSYFAWQKTWQPAEGAPADQEATRAFLSNNPEYQSLFVLDLNNGQPRFVAPVMGGGIGNNDDYYSTPPQVVVKTLADGSQVAYLLWRNRQACLISACDGREDTTVGEMNLQNGTIRFVDSHKNEGSMRLPTDEQGVLSMAGDTLLYSHWMLMGGIRITDRSAGVGDNINNPIRTLELQPVINTIATDACPQRNPSQHSCPTGSNAPGDGFQLDPGFYIYRDSNAIYDAFWRPPVRGAIIGNGSIYWRSVDGAIIALAAQ